MWATWPTLSTSLYSKLYTIQSKGSQSKQAHHFDCKRSVELFNYARVPTWQEQKKLDKASLPHNVGRKLRKSILGRSKATWILAKSICSSSYMGTETQGYQIWICRTGCNIQKEWYAFEVQPSP